MLKFYTHRLNVSDIIPMLKFYTYSINASIVSKVLEFSGYPINIKNLQKESTANQYQIYGKSIQSNLPDGYTQLEYIVADGNAYVDTGFKANTTTTRFVGAFRLTDVSVAQGFFGSRNSTKADDSSCMVVYAATGGYVRGDWVSGAANLSVPVTDNTIITVDVTRGYGVISGTTITSTKSTSVDQINNFYVGNFINGDGTMFSSGVIGHIFPCQLIDNDIVVRNLVPAKRNSDEKIGMYDIENNVFYPSVGETEFSAGPVAPTPTNPIEIKSVGDKTVNMFNKETIIAGKYIDANGKLVSNTRVCYSDFIEVEPNTTYVFSGTSQYTGTTGKRVHAYNSDKQWIAQLKASSITGITNYSIEFTPTPECKYVIVSGIIINTDTEELTTVQVQKGSEVTPYEPYGYKVPVTVAGKNILNLEADSYDGYIGLADVGELIRYGTSKVSKTYKKVAYVTAGTYTYSYDDSASTGSVRVVVCDDNEIIKEIFSTPVVQGRNETTFTVTKEGWLYVTTIAASTNKQIERGDVATAYEPYFNQTTNIYLDEPLRKLGDLTDYIDYAEQKIVRQVGAQMLMGTGWTYEPNVPRFRTSCPTIQPTDVRKTYMLADGFTAFTAGTGVDTVPNNSFYSGGPTVRTLYFKATDYNDVDTFGNAVAGTYVYFPITPTEQPITLPEISLPSGNSIVTTDTNIKPSNMYIRINL